MTARLAPMATRSISRRLHSMSSPTRSRARCLSNGISTIKSTWYYRHGHTRYHRRKKKIDHSISPSRRERSNRFGARAVAVRRPYNPPLSLFLLLFSCFLCPHSRLSTMSGVDSFLERLVSRRMHRFLGLLLLLLLLVASHTPI